MIGKDGVTLQQHRVTSHTARIVQIWCKNNFKSVKQSSTNQSMTTSEESQVKSLTTSSYMSNILQGGGAYLDIVPVKVSTKDETIQTYALLNSMSDRTFCEAHLIHKLNIC